jgi:hypothetical protein
MPSQTTTPRAAALRELAAFYWHEAEKQADPQAYRLRAAYWHLEAIKLEAGIPSQ